MKLIYTLILLFFSNSVFAEFVEVDSSVSELLAYGFVIEQIDTINVQRYVYHLRTSEEVAICYYYDGKQKCIIDTQDESVVNILNLNQ